MKAKIPYTLIKRSALDNLRQDVGVFKENVTKASAFVKEIASGNLEVQYQDESVANSELAQSLVTMRDQMKKFAQEEKQRNWVTEGLAQFVDILRSKDDNIAALSEVIISHLVKYMKANQGALYIVNDDDQTDRYLEMVACYAYNRKKHLHQRIDFGQGITGQVVLEKSTTYLTDIPKDFIRITSGLGEALPGNLLVVPLKIEDVVYGVVEIATFQKIEKYKIEFVEKLGESIASAISSVKINERTRRLLQETQEQTEQMRSQEEEMRQNMEELSATQEEMHRAQKQTDQALKQVREKEVYLNNMLNATTDAILTVDKDLHIVLANDVMKKTFQAQGVMVEVGFHVTKLAKPGQEEDFIKPYQRAFQGETVVVERSYFEHDYLITYNPLRDSDGKIIGASLFTKDVSEQKKLQRQTESLLTESQQQAEELKAQEEELRQNMEELSATQEEVTRQMVELARVKDELEVRESVFGYTTILSEADIFGAITYVNDKLCEVSGYMREELIGKPHNIFRHPDMPKELFKLFWDTIKAGKVFHGIVKNRAKDGSPYWVDATIVPVKDDSGKIIKYVGARYHIEDEYLAVTMYNKQANQLGWPLLSNAAVELV